MTTETRTAANLPAFFSEDDIDIKAFDVLCSQTTNSDDYPHAKRVEQNIVIYDGDSIREALEDPADEAALKAELCRLLNDGPGVFAVSRAYTDLTVIDRMTTLFEEIVADEKASGQGQGDHFGKNERIWNSIQKTCLRAPELFIDYYGSSILAIACEAWLGPH